jgi:alkaline phosphatase D
VISRRTFLAFGATVVAGACTSDDAAPTSTAPTSTAPTRAEPRPSERTVVPSTLGADAPATTIAATTTTAPLAANPFTLGVTAGDPDEHSAVLWTRLVGEGAVPLVDEIAVAWELAEEPAFDDVLSSGVVPASAADGHSVHVPVELGGPMWYRFRAGGWTSPAGRVAPTPAAGDRGPLRIATTSCQHFETGFYAAHRDIAEWQPDLVLFLGDFIYEDTARPLEPGRVRSHEGDEPIDLDSYRARYAQYLADPQLQASRAACPWLVIWDDHEVDNNYAGLVPEDPSETDGFAVRRAAAYQAWWEHMPVRLPAPAPGAAYPIHRRVRWGALADLILLDGRQYRSDQACLDVTLSFEPPCREAGEPTRTMLGADQERWLDEAFASATGTWTVLGQQTMMTDLRLPNGAILSYDQWDGYAPARDRVLARAAAVDRVVVLTGDIHLAAVGTLPGVGVEFVTTSISSANDIEGVVDPAALAGLFDTIVDAELTHRGYTRHTVTADSWTAEFRTVDDVASAGSPVSTWRRFRVDAGARDTARRL